MSDSTNITADDIERIENNFDALLCRLAAIEAVGQEMTPMAVISRLIHGTSPLLVWREHRGMSRELLADAADVPVADIEAVEERNGELGLRKMVQLAKALRLDAEDLLPWRETADSN